MRQLPEQCASCKKRIATLEACVLPDSTKKRGAEVTFRESAEGGIRCAECAEGKDRVGGGREPSREEMLAALGFDAEGGFVLDDSHEYEVPKIYGLNGED